MTTNFQNGKDCMRKFIANKWFGAIIFVGILAAKLLQNGKDKPKATLVHKEKK